jgi:hypothetical protein
MKNKRPAILIILLFGLTATLFAQAPTVIVEYYENTSGEMYVRTSDGAEYDVDQFGFGEELPVGTTLITLDGDYAELRMDPNGTIIRVGENTNFRVDGLQGRDGAEQNTFSVAVGKFKAVVAKQDGASYRFRGASAVMGVRGTSFIWSIAPGVEELAYVLEGVVDYTNAAGQTLALGAGQAANALAASFTAFQPPSDLIQNLESGMDFVRLRASEVPGQVAEAIEEPAEEEPMAEGPEAPETAEAETPKWLEKMLTFLGVELGTTTISEETWAKVIIQPRFSLGKLKLALYLPIIYQEDLLDASTWYRPEGNDEWSFGVDKSGEGWDEIALDALNDLVLKIRYIQWGENRDPFFFKFGNLDNLTLGHGSIMRNYANDYNFPTERKIGLNLGVNREKGGLEALVNNIAYPEIFGLRAHARPFAPALKLGFGFSALADINPERLEYGQTGSFGEPMFFNAGVDLDQPLVERESLSVIAFADLMWMIPYFREDVPLYNVSAGWAKDAFWYDGKPKNWGLDTGIFGKLSVLDYRLEFLYSDGIAESPFYDGFYDLQSPLKVQALVSYLNDPSSNQYDLQRMGIYGELGYTMDRIFYIAGGYNWNWPINPGPLDDYVNDTLRLEFGIFEDLLPVYGSIALTRVGLVAPLVNGDSIDFFDENLILSGQLVYPISPIMELALQVQSNVIDGKWYPSWGILTRLNG